MQIRSAKPGDWPALELFYRKHFPTHERLHREDIWRWMFSHQPGQQEDLPFFILEMDGGIAGTIGYIKRSLAIADTKLVAVFPASFFVDREHRGLPAIRLLRTVMSLGDVVVAMNLSQDAARLLKAGGFVDLSAKLRGFHCAARTTQSTGTGAAKSMVRRAARLARRCLLMASLRSYSHQLSTDFDRSFFAQVTQAGDGRGLTKDPVYLHWRFAESPALSCRYVYQSRAAKPNAVAILAEDPTRQTLVVLDIIGSSEERLSMVALLDEVTAIAGAAGYASVACQTTCSTLQGAFRACLFGASDGEYGVMVGARDDGIRNAVIDAGIGRWGVMPGDTDAL